MNDLIRTTVFVACAAVMCYLAFGSRPTAVVPETFSDEGEAFYPEFTDPLVAASIEVLAYDESSATATPFKVEVRDGVWSIPSHYNYPADGKDRLARTAASVIDLRKDIVQSDRLDDHAALGVIDPLDDTAAFTGRGQRVTLRDGSGAMLADFIVGREVPDKNGFRYVRLPEKKRTYAVKVSGLDLSTRFQDWIETNLLDLTSSAVSRIEIQDYSVDEGSGQVDQRDRVGLQKDDTTWTMADLPSGSEVDQAVVRAMLTALSGIRITGVRPKPESMSKDLRLREGLHLDLPTQLSLTDKGFFVSSDGRLLSNEGEVSIGTTAGVRYTLRFGEVVFGEGMAVSAGTGDAAEPTEDETGPENRYLFVTAEFDDRLLSAPPTPPSAPRPADDGEDVSEVSADDTTTAPDANAAAADHDDAGDDAGNDLAAAWQDYDIEKAAWDSAAAEGQAQAEKLNDRFAAWYYVISGSDFGKIRLDRAKLIKAEAPAP